MKKKKIIIIISLLLILIVGKIIGSNNFYILYRFKLLIPKPNNTKIIKDSRGIDYVSFQIWEYDQKKINNIKNKKCFKKIKGKEDILKITNIYKKRITGLFILEEELLNNNFNNNELIKKNNYYCYKKVSDYDYIFMILDISKNKLYVFISG